jgi:hypothetical protein
MSIVRIPSRATLPEKRYTRHLVRARRGIVCVLAMIFLVLFVVLAVGFYAATALSAQISANERAVAASQIAAESGMEFMRYQMGLLDIPATKPASQVFEEVAVQLRSRLKNTGTRGVAYDGRTIAIPDDPGGYIQLNANGWGFRATLTEAGAGLIKIKVTGSPGAAPSKLGRAIELEYVMASRPTTTFNYGVASKGKIQVKSSASTKITGAPAAAASVMSGSVDTPSLVTGGGAIDGDLAVLSSKSQVSLGGGSVGGATTSVDILADHVSVLAAPPEFPWVDTTAFKSFATNTYSGASYQKNIRVPANTNPKFNAGDVIEGILYIESPNNVTFEGHATINGLIVFENTNGVAENVMEFRGNVSPSKIPDTPEFAALRTISKGLAIAAPTAAVTMSGSVDGDLAGTVIAGSIVLDGSADLTLRQGSLIALGTDPMRVEGKTVKFVGNASDNPPYKGIRLRSWFKPNPGSYREVAP